MQAIQNNTLAALEDNNNVLRLQMLYVYTYVLNFGAPTTEQLSS